MKWQLARGCTQSLTPRSKPKYNIVVSAVPNNNPNKARGRWLRGAKRSELIAGREAPDGTTPGLVI